MKHADMPCQDTGRKDIALTLSACSCTGEDSASLVGQRTVHLQIICFAKPTLAVAVPHGRRHVHTPTNTSAHTHTHMLARANYQQNVVLQLCPAVAPDARLTFYLTTACNCCDRASKNVA